MYKQRRQKQAFQEGYCNMGDNIIGELCEDSKWCGKLNVGGGEGGATNCIVTVGASANPAAKVKPGLQFQAPKLGDFCNVTTTDPKGNYGTFPGKWTTTDIDRKDGDQITCTLSFYG